MKINNIQIEQYSWDASLRNLETALGQAGRFKATLLGTQPSKVFKELHSPSCVIKVDGCTFSEFRVEIFHSADHGCFFEGYYLA